MTETLQITRSDDYLKGRADAERWMYERYGITVPPQSPEPAGRVGAPKIANDAYPRLLASDVRQDDDVRVLHQYRENAADGTPNSAAAARARMNGRSARQDAAPTPSVRMDDVQHRLEASAASSSPSGAAAARRRMILGADGVCRSDEADSVNQSSSAAAAKRRMQLWG